MHAATACFSSISRVLPPLFLTWHVYIEVYHAWEVEASSLPQYLNCHSHERAQVKSN